MIEYVLDGLIKEKKVKNIAYTMYQILHILSILHSIDIIHGDIRSSNIFTDREGKCIKLFNFRNSFMTRNDTLDPEITNFVQNKAPEVLLEKKTLTPAIDIWSVGVLF